MLRLQETDYDCIRVARRGGEIKNFKPPSPLSSLLFVLRIISVKMTLGLALIVVAASSASAQVTLAPVWSSTLGAPSALVSGGIFANGAVEYVCRYLMDRPGSVALAGRSAGPGMPCIVAANNSEIVAPASRSELLPADGRLGWGASVAAGGSSVAAGDYGGRTRYVCRGTVSTLPGVHAGMTDLRAYPFGFSCLFGYGGAPFAATGSGVEILVLMTSAAAVADAGLLPAVVAPVSSSPTSSPSATAPAAAVIPPWVPQWALPSTFGRPPAALRAGAEGLSIIYVCTGVLADGTTLPGKYETGWGGCDIPYQEREDSDPVFTVLKASNWLQWAKGVPTPSGSPALIGGRAPVAWASPSPGWTPVVGGTANANGDNGSIFPNAINRTVCRAWHPYAQSGPHAGYTDGLSLASGAGSDPTAVACLFSYGGLVVHTSNFDILFASPPGLSADDAVRAGANFTLSEKPGTSPTRTPSNTRTPSFTPSFTPTTSLSPSPSPSPLTPPSVIWVEAAVGAVTSAPTRYVSSDATGVVFFLCRGKTASNDTYPGAYAAAGSSCALSRGGSTMVRLQCRSRGLFVVPT